MFVVVVVVVVVAVGWSSVVSSRKSDLITMQPLLQSTLKTLFLL